jgi:hypothetical protein
VSFAAADAAAALAAFSRALLALLADALYFLTGLPAAGCSETDAGETGPVQAIGAIAGSCSVLTDGKRESFAIMGAVGKTGAG